MGALLNSADVAAAGGALASALAATEAKAAQALANALAVAGRSVGAANATDILDRAAADARYRTSAQVDASITSALTSKADTARSFTGGGLITGGGNLTADRTLTVTASTNAQALTGTDTTTAMTPAATKAVTDAERAITNTALGGKVSTTLTVSGAGLATGGGALSGNLTINVPKATGAEALAGTDDTKAITPLALATGLTSRVPKTQVLNVGGLVTGGGDLSASPRTFTVTASTNAQATAGVDTTTAMTPASTKAAIDAAVATKVDTSALPAAVSAAIPEAMIPTTGWQDASASLTASPLIGGRAYQRRPRPAGVRCLAHLATLADVQGTVTGLANNANSDALYGSTSLRLTHTGAGALVNIVPAATCLPTDVRNGIIRWTFKPVANLFANMDRWQIQLHSAGTPGSPTANYHEIPVGSNSELKTRLTSQNGTGRWQKVQYAVSQFTAVGTGADLSAIIFAKVVIRAASGLQIIIDIGNVEYVPNLLTKAKCVLTFDDGYAVQFTDAARKMAKYGFRGVAYPGSVATNIRSDDPSKMTPVQLKHLHDDHGWQIGSQAWSTEAPDVSNETLFTLEMSKQRNWQNALGLTGGEDGSYFSGISQYVAEAYPVFRKSFRSMRVFGGGNGSGPPLVFGEMFPFADDYLIRAVDGDTGGWANPAVNQQAHIDQAIANKGVAIFAWHNGFATGVSQTSFDTTLAYLDAHRADIDVVTMEDLFNLY